MGQTSSKPCHPPHREGEASYPGAMRIGVDVAVTSHRDVHPAPRVERHRARGVTPGSAASPVGVHVFYDNLSRVGRVAPLPADVPPPGAVYSHHHHHHHHHIYAPCTRPQTILRSNIRSTYTAPVRTPEKTFVRRIFPLVGKKPQVERIRVGIDYGPHLHLHTATHGRPITFVRSFFIRFLFAGRKSDQTYGFAEASAVSLSTCTRSVRALHWCGERRL